MWFRGIVESMKSTAGSSAANMLLLTLAGWLSGDQRRVIEDLREDNRVLREMLGGVQPRFNDAQRRRLAIEARALSRAALRELGPLVTPDTLAACEKLGDATLVTR